MARKVFSDLVWFDWLDRYSAQQPADLWEAGWQQYLAGNESLERERAYLMANRRHDEFWYAQTFGQEWPRTPFQVAARPRRPGASSAAPVGGGALSLAPQLAAARAAQTSRKGNYSLSPSPWKNHRSFSPHPHKNHRSFSPHPRKGGYSLSPAPRRKLK